MPKSGWVECGTRTSAGAGDLAYGEPVFICPSDFQASRSPTKSFASSCTGFGTPFIEGTKEGRNSAIGNLKLDVLDWADVEA